MFICDDCKKTTAEAWRVDKGVYCLDCHDKFDAKPAPCAWCDEDTMDWNASPNGKDICNDCEDEALEESEDND